MWRGSATACSGDANPNPSPDPNPDPNPNPEPNPSPNPNQVPGCGVRVVWRPPREAVALAPPPLAAGEQGRGWEEHVVLGLLDDDLVRFTRGVEASGRRVHTLALYQDAAHRPADVADPQAARLTITIIHTLWRWLYSLGVGHVY